MDSSLYDFPRIIDLTRPKALYPCFHSVGIPLLLSEPNQMMTYTPSHSSCGTCVQTTDIEKGSKIPDLYLFKFLIASTLVLPKRNDAITIDLFICCLLVFLMQFLMDKTKSDLDYLLFLKYLLLH